MECVETPGSVLRRARQEQAMSVKELSAITRIAPRLILALEDDRYEEVPAEVFVRGFLKSCARELKLDVQQLIDVYEQHTGKQKPRKRPAVEPAAPAAAEVTAMATTAARLPRFSYVVAVLAVVFGLGLSILIFSESDREQLTNHTPEPTQQWHPVGP